MVAKNNPIQTEQFDTLKLIGIVASKPSWNSLESFIGITAVNKEMNFGIIRHLTDAVRRNRPKKMEHQHLVTPSRQCFSTPVGFGQGFLSKEQCDKTGASPITWLQLIFNLFPLLKLTLKGRRFCDAADIIKNATG